MPPIFSSYSQISCQEKPKEPLEKIFIKEKKKEEEKRSSKMILGKEDLGLSLSLTSPPPPTSGDQLLTLMPPSTTAPPQPQYWKEMFFSSEKRLQPELPFLRGRIDMNQIPTDRTPIGTNERESEDDDAGVSSPNSTLSSLSGKRRPTRSGGGGDDEHDAERESSRGHTSDEEDGGDNNGGSRKKLRLSKDQSAVLEESFKEHNTLNPKQKQALANMLNLKPRQVEVWFQNRRARTKLKQTEVDCELLKRCCDTLTEENRRLQKEVQELRALKLLSPRLYMQMAPPTTLTMCPSCERVSNSGNGSSAASETEDVKQSRVPLLHRPVPVARAAAGGGAAGPWAPIPVRPMFLNGSAQRS